MTLFFYQQNIQNEKQRKILSIKSLNSFGNHIRIRRCEVPYQFISIHFNFNYFFKINFNSFQYASISIHVLKWIEIYFKKWIKLKWIEMNWYGTSQRLRITLYYITFHFGFFSTENKKFLLKNELKLKWIEMNWYGTSQRLRITLYYVTFHFGFFSTEK